MNHKTVMLEKIRESVSSVLPITLIVIAICFTVAPVPADLMLAFLIGAIMLVIGMGLFTLGADLAMTPVGTRIGTALTRSRRLGIILPISFALGVAITVSEPDLQVLATNVPHIDTGLLIITVGVGVGLFLAICMLRTILGWSLRWMLLAFYAIIFTVAALSDPAFLSVAFDSGGVTTGPMTVPFIMALGVGVSHIRSDRNAEADSFGLVALCSIGPIIAVLILGFLYKGSGVPAPVSAHSYATTATLSRAYLTAVPVYMLEMMKALAPIVAFFLLFQAFALKMPRSAFWKTCIGVIYTFAGLVLFLTGVNVGFSSLGTVLGGELATGSTRLLLIPVSMVMGWFIIAAEPAVHVLEKQVEEVSSGAITGKAMRTSLSAAVALALGLAMVRVITGIPILWFLIPGYAAALALSFFVPSIFTAIAFDSGGVASGPMTATFLLPLAVGASTVVGGNPLTDAYGLVALVAMVPLITVQIMGVVYALKVKSAEKIALPHDDLEIIELLGGE